MSQFMFERDCPQQLWLMWPSGVAGQGGTPAQEGPKSTDGNSGPPLLEP